MADRPDIRYDGPVPKSVRLPSLAELGALSHDDLVTVLAQYGVVPSLDTLASKAQAYVSRMTGYEGERFDAAVKSLLESPTALLEQARETRRDWINGMQADGNGGAEFIWLTELDDGVCEECEARGGDIRTYDDWVASGLPGASVCLGGSRCRCELIRFED